MMNLIIGPKKIKEIKYLINQNTINFDTNRIYNRIKNKTFLTHLTNFNSSNINNINKNKYQKNPKFKQNPFLINPKINYFFYSQNNKMEAKKKTATKDVANFENVLPNAVKGKVVTRFPPEPLSEKV